MLRVNAYVLHFVSRLKKCIRERRGTEEESVKLLEANEIENAELMWIRSVQEQVFLEEISFLKQSWSKKTLYVKQFGLYMDKDNHVGVASITHPCL